MGRLLRADLKIMFRDRLNLFWALVFPLIFIGVFALFNLDEPPEVEIALVNEASGPFAQALVDNLAQVELFDVEEVSGRKKALDDLKDGAYDIVLVLPPGLGEERGVRAEVLYGLGNPQITQVALNALRGFFHEFNLQAAGVTPAVAMDEQSLSTRKLGYMDFLVPGILGMGVMNYGIISIATVLVTYREKRILRRIQVTPLPVLAFVIAQVEAFLALSILQTAVILGAGALVGADLTRNLFWAFPLTMLGNFVFLNLGIVVAAASKTVQAAAGMGNAIALPMMFLSGVFFPVEQLPAVLERVVTFLPLTPLLGALRTVLLENDSILAAWDHLALLGAWALAMAMLAVRSFRLE